MTDLEKLDESWISEFETIDTTYNKFYKEGVDFVCVTFVYINNNNQIDHIKKEKVILRPQNVLPYNVLMDLINTYQNRFSYKFDFLIKYNIVTEPSDVKYLTNNSVHENYIHESSIIDNINFQDTISMFQDLNEIFLFFRNNKQKKENSHNKTVKLDNLKNKPKATPRKKTMKNFDILKKPSDNVFKKD